MFSMFYQDTAGTTASGWVQASDNGNGSFTATSGVLSITAGPAALLGNYNLLGNPNAPAATVSPLGLFLYDNQLFPANNPVLDVNGLLFTGNDHEINIWGDGPDAYSGYAGMSNGYDYSNSTGSFTLTLVPLPPAAFAGLGTLAGVAGLGYIRRRHHVSV